MYREEVHLTQPDMANLYETATFFVMHPFEKELTESVLSGKKHLKTDSLEDCLPIKFKVDESPLLLPVDASKKAWGYPAVRGTAWPKASPLAKTCGLV